MTVKYLRASTTIRLGSGATTVFDIPNPETGTMFTTAGTGANSCALAGGGVAAKALKVTVSGTDYWIPLFSSNS